MHDDTAQLEAELLKLRPAGSHDQLIDRLEACALGDWSEPLAGARSVHQQDGDWSAQHKFHDLPHQLYAMVLSIDGHDERLRGADGGSEPR